jgi:hypothetical protein
MTLMTDELTLNLLFSATYQPMHDASRHPPKEVRVAHNYARRLLSDLYGWEEFQKLDGQVTTRSLFRNSPMLALVGGIMLLAPLLFGPLKPKRTPT